MLDLYNTNANPLPFQQRDTSNPAALQPTIPEPASLLSVNWGMAFLFRHYMRRAPFWSLSTYNYTKENYQVAEWVYKPSVERLRG